MEACFSLLESTVPEYDRLGIVRGPGGTGLEGVAPSNIFHSRDGRRIVIAANADGVFRRLCEAMGRPELADDPRFATHLARGDNQLEIEAIVAEWAQARDAAEIDRTLNDAGVICGPIYTIADIFEDPQFKAREMLLEHDDPEFGPYIGPGIVPKFSGTPCEVRWSASWEEGSAQPRGLLRPGRPQRGRPAPARAGRRPVRSLTVCDVAARDGLQNEPVTLPPSTRAELVNRLAAAGVPRIEAVSFVNPARVPQMAGAEEVVAAIEREPGVVYAGLVLNERATTGWSRPVSTRRTTPSPRPRRSISETRTRRLPSRSPPPSGSSSARTRTGSRATVTVGASFGCPFEGAVDPGRVLELAGVLVAARRRRGRVRRHDRGRRAAPGAPSARGGGRALVSRSAFTSTTRATPGLRTPTRRSRRARASSTPRSAASAAARSPPRRPETSRPRISSTSSTGRVSTPGSTWMR